jgi:hypothetical protein
VDLLANVTCANNGGQSHVFRQVLYLITKVLLYFRAYVNSYVRHVMYTTLYFIALRQLSLLCDVSLSILLYLCSSMSWFICVPCVVLLKFGVCFHAV